MITSTSNPQIKQVVNLQAKGKVRSELGLFVVEGRKMVEEVPESLCRKVFVSESYLESQKNRNFFDKFQVETVPDVVFRHMSDTKTPQGILAVVQQQKYMLEDLMTGGPVLVLEGIQDPGNLGTMLRTGEGAGIAGILADRQTVDRYNPKVVRSTMGSLYRVPYVVSEDLRESVKTLKKRGFSVYAAYLKGTENYTDIRYPKASAYLIGNEGNGLTDETAQLADTYVRIPMEGRVESLNAAVAAALLMYEWHRQQA